MLAVFFDFDGTLTTKDSVFSFGLFLLRRQGRRLEGIAKLSLLMVLLKLRVVPNNSFREKLAKLLVTGEEEQTVKNLAKEFLVGFLGENLNPLTFEILEKHREQGEGVYIVSSNFDFLLSPLQSMWKVAGVVATRTEVRNGVFTGKLASPSCHGQEKVDRLAALLGEAQIQSATAYGDSSGDLPMLKSVRTGYWVKSGTAPRIVQYRASRP